MNIRNLVKRWTVIPEAAGIMLDRGVAWGKISALQSIDLHSVVLEGLMELFLSTSLCTRGTRLTVGCIFVGDSDRRKMGTVFCRRGVLLYRSVWGQTNRELTEAIETCIRVAR